MCELQVVSVEVVEPFNVVAGDRTDILHMSDGTELYVSVALDYPDPYTRLVICEVDGYDEYEFTDLPQSYQDMCMADINQWTEDGCGQDF